MAKAIFFDVDKTLTNSKSIVTEKTVKALKLLSETNIYSGVITNRHMSSILNHILPMFSKSSNHITSDGGQIVTSQGTVIWESLIENQMALDIIKNVEYLGGAIIFGSGSREYYTQKAFDILTDNFWRRERRLFENNDKYTFSSLSVVQLNPKVKKYIKSLDNVSVHFLKSIRNKEYFNITAKDVNKESTVRIWANMVGLKMEDICVVSDNDEDVSLLSNVGWGVAMGNASNKLKKVAKEVIGDCDNDGLATFLDHFLENSISISVG